MSPNYVEVDGACLLGRIRLLLVDTDPEERARLQTALEPRFAVCAVSNAEEAVNLLERRYFEAILTDYALGPRTGAWLLEYVFEHHSHIHRALMSATGVPELDELRARGIVWLFNAKPVDGPTFCRYFAEPWETEGPSS